MTIDQVTPMPALMLQFVDPSTVGVDPESGLIPNAMWHCVQLLGEISVAPERVRLVVTGDFVRSVQERLGEHPAAEDFDLQRGSGLVAGKTMPEADGSIDVLLHSGFFSTDLNPEERASAADLAVRTVVHEAHHVAMRQNDQSYETPADQTWRDRNFTSSADSIIDEYRAEAGASTILVADDPSWSPLDVLNALSRELGEVTASYQEHHDVEKLAFQVETACLIAWRAMAYIAATDVIDPEKSPVTFEVLSNPRWQRMAAHSWDKFREVLAGIQPGQAVLTQPEIAAKVEELAEILSNWLADLGFVWVGESFKIETWYFDDDDFMAAMADQS